MKGHTDCCNSLLEYGADPNDRSTHGNTILEAAAKSGNLDIVELLVVAGAKVNPDSICRTSTPLQAAIESPESNPDVVWYLLEQGGDVEQRRQHDRENAMSLAHKKDAFFRAQISERQRLEEAHIGYCQHQLYLPFQ